jgi:hypothetical protein
VNIFQTELTPKIIFILGIINLLSALLVLSTCRCIPGLKIFTGKLMQNAVYKQFYKYHCYIWWIFWTSVVVHVIFAIGLVGVPF